MQFRCPFLGVSPMCNVFLPEIIIPSARDLMKPSWLDLPYWVENCNRSLTKCHSSNSSQANFSGYLIVIHCMKKTAPTNVFLLYYYAINNFLSVIIATIIIIIIIIIYIIIIIRSKYFPDSDWLKAHV